MNEPKHLWEIDHPYYCQEGNYYKNGCHNQFANWGEFYEAADGWDMDMNLLFRWDWRKPEKGVIGTLSTFWVGQRKAALWSCECPVHPDEEPAVREFLQPRLAHLLALWQPLPLPSLEEIQEHAREEDE